MSCPFLSPLHLLFLVLFALFNSNSVCSERMQRLISTISSSTLPTMIPSLPSFYPSSLTLSSLPRSAPLTPALSFLPPLHLPSFLSSLPPPHPLSLPFIHKSHREDNKQPSFELFEAFKKTTQHLHFIFYNFFMTSFDI